MNKNDRAHPSLMVYKNLPDDIKAKYTYRKKLVYTPKHPTKRMFKRTRARFQNAVARFSRWLNRRTA